MLLVKARVGPSAIHGLGLIAHEFIPAGTRVWTFVPGFDLVITENEMSALSATAQEQIRWYAY